MCNQFTFDPAAADEASERDRMFFERHPDRTHRLRPARAGELPGLDVPVRGWSFVLVKQVARGFRVRVPFVAPDLILDTEARAKAIAAVVLPRSAA